MMDVALAAARNGGAETELWTTAGKDLKPCDACDSCRTRGGECHIKDDMQALYPKVLAADGLIFGSPSYFMSGTAQAKIVIDRLYAPYNQYVLPNKVAGAITVANSRGHTGAWNMFRNLFELCHWFTADYAAGFAAKKGEVRKDDYAMKSAEELGKEVVSMIKQNYRYPDEYRRPIYRICRETHGIDSYPLRHTRQGK
jgi:multimeric flavodoxin WrbA